MTTQRARKISAVLVIAAVLLSVLGLVWGYGRPHQTWKLADGSELTFLKVTTGAVHEVPTGNSWRDRLYPLVPARFKIKVGARIARHTSPNTNAVVVWFKRGKTRSPPGDIEPHPYRLSLRARNGLEAGLLERPDSTFFLRKGIVFEAWELREYPRHARDFSVRVLAAANSPNPTFATRRHFRLFSGFDLQIS